MCVWGVVLTVSFGQLDGLLMNRASVWLSLGPAGEYPGWLRPPGAIGREVFGWVSHMVWVVCLLVVWKTHRGTIPAA